MYIVTEQMANMISKELPSKEDIATCLRKSMYIVTEQMAKMISKVLPSKEDIATINTVMGVNKEKEQEK